MFVSIIQPVYNAEKYLEETIISVLQQTHFDFEYILIDDGSDDLSYSLILKYAKIDNRIRILKHEVNKGYIAALNNGIRNSKFEYIFRIDSDDLISSTTLTNRINAYISNPNCVLVSGIPTLFSNSKTENILLKYFPTNLNTTNWVLQWGNPITHSSSFFKKEHFNSLGGYINAKNLEDWDLWNKFNKIGEIILLDSRDIFYRLHENQSTKSNKFNPHFQEQVVDIINRNITINKNQSTPLDINYIQILWALYTDTNTKDITIGVFFKALKFYNSKLKQHSNFSKELSFFVLTHKLRMINRLNNKILKFIFTFLYLLVKSPQILFIFPDFSGQYLTYLKNRRNFFKGSF